MTALMQHLIDAITLGSLYAVLAIGIALIFGIMNLINLAFGELIMLGAYALWIGNSLPWPLQMAICLLVTMAVALLMDRVAFRPFRGASGPVLLVTSFAVSFALQSMMTVAVGSRAKGVSLPNWLDHSIALGGVTFTTLNLITVVAMVVLIGGLAGFLKRSMVGIQMRAAAESFSTARLLGVRADRVIGVAFVLSGLFAGVASILIVAQTGIATPTMGAVPVLIAFVATIIGGLGSLYGAAFGGFILGALTVILQVLLPQSLAPYRDALVYVGVLVVLLLRPNGLVVVRALKERV